ncbi:NrdH-redoxin [Naasia lichenicola]|uniref:NrdH-redoxin n=1 Tax=Naasia lichenicola TaxID=2565933 RepID=A0A4S4FJB4_9MICO|nr:NrdH-redoxin [Naasia lichenicola]THG29315.1 NrdH-redoxin [Naasia lichenicola]
MSQQQLITVYIRPGDPDCIATTKALSAAGLEYVIVDLSAPGVSIPSGREFRVGQLPLVTVGAALWGGYRPDKIAIVAAINRRPKHRAPVDPEDGLDCDSCQ